MKRALERVPGVERAEVDASTGRATVTYTAGPGEAGGSSRLVAAVHGTVLFPRVRRLLGHLGHGFRG